MAKPTYVYDGTNWVSIAGSSEYPVRYSATSPTNASQGTLWIDTTDPESPIMKVYDGTTWLEISGAGGGGGLKTKFLLMGA
jgi:hypothetical protein